jgi:thiamine-monophosphate kinase
MALGEFELIDRYFKRSAQPGSEALALGIGDDCALLQPSPGMQLAVSSDMLVAGRHFFPDVNPKSLGHKALAVNLSDLAACGARPLGFTLALALPEANAAWLEPFSQGLLALADAYHCPLIGGDTTQGPLNICITVFGEVPPGMALLRSGAHAGDDIWVSGTLGDARLALEHLRGTVQLPGAVFAKAQERMDRPTPRVALGQALRGIASAAIDVSDGMLGDLCHILQQSAVGATIDTTLAMQLIATGAVNSGAKDHFDYKVAVDLALMCVLSGGDDYELVFTAAPAQRDAVQSAGSASGTPVLRIGRIDAERGLRLLDTSGNAVANAFTSFDHFA